jgi:hypothetical protein
MTSNSQEYSQLPNRELIHPAAVAEEILLRDCDVRRQRRSGPGGQHRNKVETAVIITHTPTGIHGEASERRSQEQNRSRALFRLRVNLALQVRSPPAAPTVASELWTNRCAVGKLAISPGHDDFPALLAEALDAIFAADMEAKEAAAKLACTPSQMIKLLQLEPRAIELVNRQRRLAGKSIYR